MTNNQKHAQSILVPIIKDVYAAKTLEEGKKLMKDLVGSKKIKEQDKKKMLYEIEKIQSLTKLQFYATNAFLRFEGLSVNTYNTGSK
jgi:hypothetical protein